MKCSSRLAYACVLAASLPLLAQADPPARSLDLKAPSIHRIFTLEQINAVLTQANEETIEHVDVEAARIAEQLPQSDDSGVEAVFQTVARLIGPYTPEAASRIQTSAAAADAARPVPLAAAMYHPSFQLPESQR